MWLTIRSFNLKKKVTQMQFSDYVKHLRTNPLVKELVNVAPAPLRAIFEKLVDEAIDVVFDEFYGARLNALCVGAEYEEELLWENAVYAAFIGFQPLNESLVNDAMDALVANHVSFSLLASLGGNEYQELFDTAREYVHQKLASESKADNETPERENWDEGDMPEPLVPSSPTANLSPSQIADKLVEYTLRLKSDRCREAFLEAVSQDMLDLYIGIDVEPEGLPAPREQKPFTREQLEKVASWAETCRTSGFHDAPAALPSGTKLVPEGIALSELTGNDESVVNALFNGSGWHLMVTPSSWAEVVAGVYGKLEIKSRGPLTSRLYNGSPSTKQFWAFAMYFDCSTSAGRIARQHFSQLITRLGLTV